MAPGFVAMLVVACGSSDGLFGDSGSGSSPQSGSATSGSGGDSSSAGNASGGSTSNTGAVGGASGVGGSAQGVTSSAQSVTTQASSTTTGGGHMCRPEATDSPCEQCIKADCCGQVIACPNDANCACITQCLGNNNELSSCVSSCGGWGQVWGSLYTCLQTNCVIVCN